MNKKILFILLISSSIAFAQQGDSSSINYYKLGLVSGITAAGFVYGHIFQQDLWWKGEKSSFHFEWNYDWRYALGADKFGHFFFPYLVTNIYADALEWTGIKRKKSLLYASTLAFIYQTYVEMRDGFSKRWGFSWGDFTANSLGAAYPLLQNEFPVLKNINFKISYYPSERFRNNSHKSLIDDYESTYSWVSFNVYNFLPESLQEYFPSFINIAVGHSVKRLDFPGSSYHEIYLGLDWNLEALPGDSAFLKKLKKYLNYYHFPAPAVRITPGVVWYGLKF